MQSGDVLAVGDMFTQIDNSGSAGNQPIRLSGPWVQKYEGIITIPEDDPWYPDQEMVLFSCLIPNQTDKFVFSKGEASPDKGTEEGFYLAYLRFCDTMLFHLRGGGGSCVTKCKSIVRYPPAA